MRLEKEVETEVLGETDFTVRGRYGMFSKSKKFWI